MIEVDLKAGDIITWENYPIQMNETKPRRWFLYLGNQTVQAVVYQITTTTQYQYYEAGGTRAGNNHFRIPAGVGGLEKDSIVDLRFFENIPESLVNRHKTDIKKKGTLNQDHVNKFAKHLKNDKYIVPMIKRDIYGYLKNAGFKIGLG